MKLIADLLWRVWPSSQPASIQTLSVADDRDRSSMADFVRILQAHDQGRKGWH
jgi:hypothetical protein